MMSVFSASRETFVIANPHLPDCPMTHVSDGFLEVSSDEYAIYYAQRWKNCTFLCIACASYACGPSLNRMHACVLVLPPHPNTRAQLTGYSREEVVGRNCRFLQGPRTDQETVSRLRDTVIAGGEITVKVCDGPILWSHIRGAGMHASLEFSDQIRPVLGLSSQVVSRCADAGAQLQTRRLNLLESVAHGPGP
jgi:hypothetical protein